jgi:hypothetical protein
MANFSNFAGGVSGPGTSAEDITPDNSNDLDKATRGIYVGVSGDVKVDMVRGGTVTFIGLAAGIIHPIRAIRVYATGTTATSIIGVY